MSVSMSMYACMDINHTPIGIYRVSPIAGEFWGGPLGVAIGITRMHNPDSRMHVRVFLSEVIRK